MTEQRAGSIRVMHPLFQAEEGGSTPTSALQLRLHRIDFATARQLNRLWHSRLPNYGRGFIHNQSDLCYAAQFEGVCYGVGLWSNPIARKLPQQEWLELRRLAIAPDAPPNTASRMLAIMARLVKADKPLVTTLVSYHDCDVHTGGIYRAAGWTATLASKPTRWDVSARRNKCVSPVAPRQRWEKVIRDAPVKTTEAVTESGVTQLDLFDTEVSDASDY